MFLDYFLLLIVEKRSFSKYFGETCLIISEIEWAVARMTGHNFSLGKHSSQKRKTFRFSEKFQTAFDLPPPPVSFSVRNIADFWEHIKVCSFCLAPFFCQIYPQLLDCLKDEFCIFGIGTFPKVHPFWWGRECFPYFLSTSVSSHPDPQSGLYNLSLRHLFKQCSNKIYISEHLNFNRSVQNSDSVRLCMRPYK